MDHFAWIPKYLCKVFVDLYREAMMAIIFVVEYDWDIQNLEIPEDHMHISVCTMAAEHSSPL